MAQPIVFPDPISNLTEISGAMLLYFDGPILAGLPASVVPAVAEQSLRTLKLVQERNPIWAADLYFVLELAVQQAIGVKSVFDRMESIRDTTLVSVYFSYPATEEMFSASCEVATEISGRLPQAEKYVTRATAASELRRHIFLEAYLAKDGDIVELYEYCSRLFGTYSLDHLLLSAYMLRAAAFQQVASDSGVLLTNPRVAKLLAAAVPETTEAVAPQVADVVAWEIFRQIISPRLDPLTDDRISVVGEIRKQREGERVALVERCRDIASKLIERSGELEPDEICRFVATRVEPEIAALLELDRNALRGVIDDLFSDKATWMGIAGFISGLTRGSALLTTTSAIATLSALGAAAYKQDVRKRSTLAGSDLRLVYYIDRRE